MVIHHEHSAHARSGTGSRLLSECAASEKGATAGAVLAVSPKKAPKTTDGGSSTDEASEAPPPTPPSRSPRQPSPRGEDGQRVATPGAKEGAAGCSPAGAAPGEGGGSAGGPVAATAPSSPSSTQQPGGGGGGGGGSGGGGGGSDKSVADKGGVLGVAGLAYVANLALAYSLIKSIRYCLAFWLPFYLRHEDTHFASSAATLTSHLNRNCPVCR